VRASSRRTACCTLKSFHFFVPEGHTDAGRLGDGRAR
jgi:hypothetical protein